ncbi:MAG: DUF3316 domain-containing protein [Clostridium sp.]|nr:DUF3316 domain-containing protein [Clostridium sp.]
MEVKKILRTALAIMFSCTSVLASADDEGEARPLRPVYSVWSAGAGSSHLADTYLTPLKYSGWQASIGYERLQAMRFSPDNWVMRLAFDASFDRTENPAGNATMWFGGIEASWSMVRRWTLPEGFSAGVGGETGLDLGCLLNTRNGNNPASAKASWTVGVRGYGAWNGRIGRLPLTLRLDMSLPVTGIFFSPDYGELYYEIWLGNHSGLVHPAWFGNYFRLDTRLTADLRFGATILRLGYGFRAHTTDVNNLVSRQFRHSAIIGVASDWISLSPGRKLSESARIIQATY